METDRLLVLTAAVLVGFSAIVHLILGLGGMVEWLTHGDRSLLAVLFVLSGLGILAGIGAVTTGVLPPRPAYVLGAFMMAIYLVGYADWHAFGVTESILGLEGHDHHHHDHDHDHDHSHDHDHDHGHGHEHDGGAITVLGDHLVEDPLALLTKSAEAVALGLLLILSVASWNRA